jgi:hypothetical protein
MSSLKNELRLSKEVIENTVKRVLTEKAIRNIERRKKAEIDCEKSFKIIANLVVNANDDFNCEKIPSFYIKDCRRFEEFRSLMKEYDIKVLEHEGFSNKAIYKIKENSREISFT